MMRNFNYTRGARLATLLIILFALLALSTFAAAGQHRPASDEAAMPPLEGGAVASPPVMAPSDSAGSTTVGPTAPTVPAIQLWYGPTQKAGHRGDPQKWVNVLGTISGTPPLSAAYTLNGGPSRPLSLGPDDLRLARPGDFNIELDYTDLQPGANKVVITAGDANGSTSAEVIVNYQGGGVTWSPGTYTYDWSGAGRIDDLAQVVDGHWVRDGNTVRPVIFDFDRLVAIGDMAWRDYTVTVPITVHAIDESGYVAPSNGPGVGIIVRWSGHYEAGDGVTPVTGWRRLGALAWYRWQRRSNVYTEGLQLLGHTGRLLAESDTRLAMGTPYYFKLAIQSPANPSLPSFYRFKMWRANQPEPAAWEFEERGINGEPSGGSLILLAHHVDAQFGPVRVDLATTRPRPTIAVTTDGNGLGGVALSPPGPTFRFGEDVILAAGPALGSTFAGWSGDLSGTTNPATLTLFENAAVTATFNRGGHGVALPVVVSGE